MLNFTSLHFIRTFGDNINLRFPVLFVRLVWFEKRKVNLNSFSLLFVDSFVEFF